MRKPAIQRFYAKIKRHPNGCILWKGALVKGYGLFGFKKRLIYAHRFLWEHLYGSIPDGLEMHHVCENKACVNPRHLQLVTHREHIMRTPKSFGYLNSRKTHCPHGHEYTPENTHIYGGQRVCRECRKIYRRKYELKRKIRSLPAVKRPERLGLNEAVEIILCKLSGESSYRIAPKYNISSRTVRFIVTGKQHKNASLFVAQQILNDTLFDDAGWFPPEYTWPTQAGLFFD